MQNPKTTLKNKSEQYDSKLLKVRKNMEQITKLILFVAFYFFILFSAYNAFQNIVTKIHEEEGDHVLGPFALAMNYFGFMLMNLFVVKFQGNLEKWYIVFPSLAYAFFYVTGFLIDGTPKWERYFFTGLGAVVGGVSSSFLWTNAGSYIHKAAHIFRRNHLKGYYYGIFNFLMSSSSIVGAIIVTFGLQLFSHKGYFLLVSLVAVFSFVFGLFLIKDLRKIKPERFQDENPISNQQNQHQEDHEGEENENIENQAEKASVLQSAKKTIKFYKTMKYSLPLIFIDGIHIAIASGIMLRLLPQEKDEKKSNLITGFCLFFYGFGSMIGGYIGGKLCDIFRIKKTVVGILGVFLFSCALTIVSWYLKGNITASICCFLWGFMQYSLSACLMVICSRLYAGRSQSFAIVKQFHCFAFILFQIFTISTQNKIPVSYIMIFITSLSLPAFYGLSQLPEQSINPLLPNQKQSIISSNPHSQQ